VLASWHTDALERNLQFVVISTMKLKSSDIKNQIMQTL